MQSLGFPGLRTSGRIRASWAFTNQASAAERLPAPQVGGETQRLLHVVACSMNAEDSLRIAVRLGHHWRQHGVGRDCNPPISGICPWFSALDGSQTSPERTVGPILLAPGISPTLLGSSMYQAVELHFIQPSAEKWQAGTNT